MGDSKTLHLEFIGMDSWERPVYKDDTGTLWKDVDPRAGMKPDLCTSVNNELDGEPDTGMKYMKEYQDVTVAFEPEEGCLSLTGKRKTVRYKDIEVAFQDIAFKKQKQKFSGYVAQIIQHEMDHLEGIII